MVLINILNIKRNRVTHAILYLVVTSMIMIGCGSNSKKYRGDGYTIQFPDHWKKGDTRETMLIALAAGEDPDSIAYYSPIKDSSTSQHEASITIFSQSFTQAFWIEDKFPEILNIIKGRRLTIVDHGQFDLDKVLTKWVLYFDTNKEKLNLELFLVTEASVFINMKYSATVKYFQKYRSDFEATKASFKTTFGLF